MSTTSSKSTYIYDVTIFNAVICVKNPNRKDGFWDVRMDICEDEEIRTKLVNAFNTGSQVELTKDEVKYIWANRSNKK